jgi:hypothetical protein
LAVVAVVARVGCHLFYPIFYKNLVEVKKYLISFALKNYKLDGFFFRLARILK